MNTLKYFSILFRFRGGEGGSGTFFSGPEELLKVIVSRDFQVCFFVLLDRSEIAIPDKTIFMKILCRIFYYSGLGGGSFP
jgi:hypothetical protein